MAPRALAPEAMRSVSRQGEQHALRYALNDTRLTGLRPEVSPYHAWTDVDHFFLTRNAFLGPATTTTHSSTKIRIAMEIFTECGTLRRFLLFYYCWSTP